MYKNSPYQLQNQAHSGSDGGDRKCISSMIQPGERVRLKST